MEDVNDLPCGDDSCQRRSCASVESRNAQDASTESMQLLSQASFDCIQSNLDSHHPQQPWPLGPEPDFCRIRQGDNSVEMIILVPVNVAWGVITDWFGWVYGWPDDVLIMPIAGSNACPGALRYLTDCSNPGGIWMVERLLSVWPAQNEISYRVEASNVDGISGHKGSCRLSPVAIPCTTYPASQSDDSNDSTRGGERSVREGSKVVWSFELPEDAAGHGFTVELVRQSLIIHIKRLEKFCILNLC